MAKRTDSKYVSGGRTDNWLKIKTSKRQEVVIAEFTGPQADTAFLWSAGPRTAREDRLAVHRPCRHRVQSQNP